jgi:tRNA pseudouridine38-40 synthase
LRAGVLLTVAYDGTTFHGYALQREARTAASELLAAIGKMDPAVAELRGVSRTDAGVHARGQLVAFDPSRNIATRGWVLGLGAHLPDEIAVRCATMVPEGFEPRRHVVRKHYRYTLLLDPRRDPFSHRYAWRLGPQLDLEIMQAEASSLVGPHDFAAFRSSADERVSTVRRIDEARVARSAHEERIVHIDVIGDGFLHNMVRIVAGTLVDCGRGRLAPGAVARALSSHARSDLGMTAPAHGLCLESVELEPGFASEPWPLSGTSAANRAT